MELLGDKLGLGGGLGGFRGSCCEEKFENLLLNEFSDTIKFSLC